VCLSAAQVDKPGGHLGKKGGMACDGAVPSPSAVPDLRRLGASSKEGVCSKDGMCSKEDVCSKECVCSKGGTHFTFPKVLSGAPLCLCVCVCVCVCLLLQDLFDTIIKLCVCGEERGALKGLRSFRK